MTDDLRHRAINRLFKLRLVQRIPYERHGASAHKAVDFWAACADPVLFRIFGLYIAATIPAAAKCIAMVEAGGLPPGVLSAAYHHLPILFVKTPDRAPTDGLTGPPALNFQINKIKDQLELAETDDLPCVVVDDSIRTGASIAGVCARLASLHVEVAGVRVLFQHDLDGETPRLEQSYHYFLSDRELLRELGKRYPDAEPAA